MRTINKLINFFTSTYYDNIKYKHSTASLLKIFFERANKTTKTVANLGNVYRNSKWSDLKIQNIKTTHVWSFTKTFILLTLIFILFYLTVFRLDNSLFTTFIKPLALVWSYIADWTIYFFTLISLFFYYLQARLTSYLNKIYSSIFGNFLFSNNLPTSTDSNNTNSNLVCKSDLSLVSDRVNLKGAENIVRHAYKVSDLMLKLNQTELRITTQYPLFKNTNRLISAYLEVSKPNHTQSYKTFSLSNLESSFIQKLDLSLSNSVYKLNLNSNYLNSSNNSLTNILDYSINENLSVAKQSRWLLRNIPVSECLSNSNFTYTQAKSLLGNASYNSLISSKNIWASNKANNLLFVSLSSFNESLNASSTELSSLINYFEDSRNFINKKAYYTLQPRLNTTKLVPIVSLDNSLANEPILTLQDTILLDLNLLLLGNTLSAGSYINITNNLNSVNNANLFTSNDYLTYFTNSHDNFVISLNNTSFNNNHSFSFFNIQKLNTILNPNIIL